MKKEIKAHHHPRTFKSKGYRLAIVASRFNEEICEGLIQGAYQGLKEMGLSKANAHLYRVPGAFEIPLIAKWVAQSNKYKGVVCVGALIRGETPHFEYISQAVTQALSTVALDTLTPVGFGVITTNTLDQALSRSRADSFNKGREAALAVLEMIKVMKI